MNHKSILRHSDTTMSFISMRRILSVAAKQRLQSVEAWSNKNNKNLAKNLE